jgi:hypothetical protein
MSVHQLPYHGWLSRCFSLPPPFCVASIYLAMPPPIKDTLAKQHLFSPIKYLEIVNSLSAMDGHDRPLKN